jgi:aryl sulfotransferase
MPKLYRGPTRAVRSRIFDSARWDGYQPRDDDIIIATYPKCGTTWMQRIVSMLVFQSATPTSLWDVSPWLDMRLLGPIEDVLAKAEAQTHRRFFKTHLPFDALPVYAGMKFIHVARDGRDAAMSFHNFTLHMNADTQAMLGAINRDDPKFGDDPPPVPENAAEYFSQWVDDGGAQGDDGASFFNIENSFWAERLNENVLLVHYNDLKADRDGEMRRIAKFLEIDIPESLWPDLISAASFEAMKVQGDELIPMAQMLWEGGARRFWHKGTTGQWQGGVISAVDLRRYDAQVKANFAPDLARWVEHGRIVAGDPDARS